MRFDQNYNINDLPQATTTPVDPGTYNVEIVNAEIKTAAKGGTYLNLEMKILGPKYTERRLFNMITLTNSSTDAVDIGRQQLRDLMEACALSVLRDTDDLLGKAISVRVDVKDNPDYGPQNRIKKMQRPTGMAAPVTSSQPAPNPQTPPRRPF